MHQLSKNDHLRTFDDGGSERPIETQRLFVAEIPAGAETEKGEAPAIPSACNDLVDGLCPDWRD